MDSKGKDQRISISLYIDELKDVENLIDDVSKEISNKDDKYVQVLSYLQRRKQNIQYEIQEHAKYSQEYYKEKLKEIEGLIERENKKITKLEESEEIKGISSETLEEQVVLNGEEGKKRDLIISKGVLKDLTKVAKYIEGEIEYFQSINVIDDEKEEEEDKGTTKFNSYEEEIEIIEGIVGNFNGNNDSYIRNYLKQRKYGIYYSAQTAINEVLEQYTGKLKEIETLILSEAEKKARLEQNESIREGNLEVLIYEAINDENSEARKLAVSAGTIEDLSKIRGILRERIEFLESIDIYKDGLPNMEKKADTDKEEQKTSMGNSNNIEKDTDLVKEVPKDNEELSQGDKFLIVSKPAGRFGFIKNTWNKIRARFAKKLEKNEIFDDTDSEKTAGNPKEETLKERIGGYNSQNEFEKKAMAAIEQQKQVNGQVKKRANQQYGE